MLQEVRIGIAEPPLGSLDVEDGQLLSTPLTSGSPPHQAPGIVFQSTVEKEKEREKDRDKADKIKTTPPSSPNISAIYAK